ncbi:MAG: Nramp family divalent metal transporter [Pyrinomonadaceae bacterium]
MTRFKNPFLSIRTFPSKALSRLRKALAGYRFYVYLAYLGPGIIAVNAGNEAGGIATYSTVGASFGYSLLWTFIPMTIALIVVQEMCVRMGIVTGQGLADLIRERFGVRLTALVMFALLIANQGVIISQFVGVAQISEMFGIPRFVTVPIAGALIWVLVVRGSQERVEKVFLLISTVFLCYIASAFFAAPDWSEVGKSLFTPSLSSAPGYLFTVMALIGTTVTPFMQFFVQSSTVEKKLDDDDLSLARTDVAVGTGAAMLVAACIVIAAAATLHKAGVTTIESASTAAEALAPVAGAYAKYLFAVGLFGASMLAMGVLPLATAYSISEALGFEKGLSRSFKDAPIFLGIFTLLLLVGASAALIPGLPPIRILLLTQAINGVLLPVILVSIVTLSSNVEIMGKYRNGMLFRLVAWFVTVIVSILSLMLLAGTIVDIFS